MMEIKTLYEKRGRKYVPHSVHWSDVGMDIKVGEFVLVYAYKDGGRMYQYGVKPDTAAWAAAAKIAEKEIVKQITEAATPLPADGIKYTKKQLEIIKRFRKEMTEANGRSPAWWKYKSANEIAKIAIDAVENYRP
jgi:hypothetical protein